jgi:hypothetical protein
MRTWTRTVTDMLCGGCGAFLAKDAPIQLITWTNLKRPKVRCEACATEPVPAVVPPRVAATPLALTHIDDDGIERPGPSPSPMTPIRDVVKSLDWKQKASGE